MGRGRVIAVVRNLIAAAAIAHGVNTAAMDQMAACESSYRPWAVNEPNIGLYQLSRYGKLREFYQRGYDDPFDPAQQSNFVAEQLVLGAGPAWTCFPKFLPILMTN